ncbi:MAG: hypothetical protein Q8P18_32380 [Pseudomonadota bacterium]|nr:hypothetical protein [Pseudomonadota bacterium]
MYVLLGSFLACLSPEGDGPDRADDPEPLVLFDEWPDYTPAGDAVYIRYDEVPNMVRATPAGVEVLDLGGRVPLWAEATPDGRFLLVLTSSDAGIEHVLIEDGAIAMVFPDQETNRVEVSPDGRHLALWYDGTLDPHTELLVDVGQITLVDTEAGVATRVATSLVPRTVSLGDERGLIVGTRGALGLDLLTQTAGQDYDFEGEGVENGAWGYWGVLSADEAYGLVSAEPDEADDTVVRLGLAERSFLTVESPLSPEYDGVRYEVAPRLFRVGDALFAHTDSGGLATLEPETLAFTVLDPDVHFSLIEVQEDRAVLYDQDGETAGEEGTHILWTDPLALHWEPVNGRVNGIWFGDDHAVLQRYEGETWHVKVLDLGTGATWLKALQDVPDWGALMTVNGSPMALLAISGVDSYGLLPLAAGSSLASVGTERLLFGAMANDEAFYVTDMDDAGFIGFVDPLALQQIEYSDFTELDLLRER